VADALIDQVSDLIREVAATVVLPRFRHLSAADVHEKVPGDLVTIADQESERALTLGLTGLLPDSIVVGEESVAADPSVLDGVSDDGAVWIVDPVDGTNNFAAGKTPFAVMVALLRGGEPAASWIFEPVGDQMTIAEAGSGAWMDGVRLTCRTDSPGATALDGSANPRYLPEDLAFDVFRNSHRLGEVTAGAHCAGWEYPAVVTDRQQFALFWRILPWDHVPGSLIVRESGGTVLHLDGSAYRPTDNDRGLIIAPNDEVWHTVRSALFG
jgi:fructose-1,6-bisphosphatase/inositol monophosphatase family enzyme